MNSKLKIKNSKILRAAMFLIAGCALTLSIMAQSGGTQQNLTGKAGTFAITNARIVPVSGAVIENGTIVISNGKIAAIGANASVPAGAERIDGTGLSVFPGMIDAGTNMGLVEIGNGVAGSVDLAETGDINPNAKAILGINPNSANINVTRVNGVTTVLSIPSSGDVAGQAAVINLNGSTQMEMAVVPEFAMVVNFPRVTTFAGFSPVTGPRIVEFGEAVKNRDKKVENLKKIFDDAMQYAKAKDAYARDKKLPYIKTDLKMEAMLLYLRGEKPVIFIAERESDIRSMIKFANDMKIKAILMGGGEAYKAADELRKNNIPVIFNKIFDSPGQDDAYDEYFETPSILQKAGVKFCISTGDDGANVRDLPYQAGMAAAFGLSKDEALKSVTIYPAQILGIDKMYGSLEPGKMANVVVADGDILDPRTNIKHLFINGRKLPLTSRHTELYDAYKDRK